MQAAGDPPPAPDLLVLYTTPPAGRATLRGGAIVVRESDLPGLAGPDTAVFAAPDGVRWSDVYDQVRWAVGESIGQLAEHDAFHLADALATAVGGAVAIEDARRRVVAFSTVPGQRIDEVRRQGILGRQVPKHVEREAWYGRLRRASGASEFVGGTESTARMAIAVRAGAEPLGSIWVVGSRETLNPGAEQLLERSVDAVAACLAHQDHFAAHGREARGQLLRRILDEGAVPGDHGLSGRSVLVALARDGAAPDPDLALARLADVLSLHAHRVQGRGLAAVLSGRVYALLPATEPGRLVTQLRGILDRGTLPAVRVAVGEVVERSDQLSASRRQVDRLLTLRPRQGDGPGPAITFVADQRENLVLAELAEALRPVAALRDGPLRRLADHDRQHSTAYLATLRAWFESGGDSAVAAARLHVHANTFRYRMARVGDLFGIRLDHPDQRLLLHLQLRLGEIETE